MAEYKYPVSFDDRPFNVNDFNGDGLLLTAEFYPPSVHSSPSTSSTLTPTTVISANGNAETPTLHNINAEMNNLHMSESVPDPQVEFDAAETAIKQITHQLQPPIATFVPFDFEHFPDFNRSVALADFEPDWDSEYSEQSDLHVNLKREQHELEDNRYKLFIEEQIDRIRLIGPDCPPVKMYDFDPKNPPPFVDLTKFAWPSDAPVVKISSIPFSCTKDEVASFLRRNLLPNQGHAGSQIIAIHVIMGRGNARTLDCYIELGSVEAQLVIIDRYNNLLSYGNPPKMMNRYVTVEISSQKELMKEVFPLACCMDFGNRFAIPVKVKNTDKCSTAFKGFLTTEQLTSLLRSAVDPERNPHGGKCIQRPFDMMMTILEKFPACVPYFTVDHRDKIWITYRCLLEYMNNKVNFGVTSRDERVVGLDAKLLKHFVAAGMKSPIFTEWHRSEIVVIIQACNADYGVTSIEWPFEILSKIPGVTDQDLHMWFEVMNFGGSTIEFNQYGQGLWSNKYFTVVRQPSNRVEFKLHDNYRTTGLNDLARIEYDMMMTLMSRGWDIWLDRQGLFVGDVPAIRLDTYMDVELNELMVRLGVFSKETIDPMPEKALSCIGMFNNSSVDNSAIIHPATTNEDLRIIDMEEELELSLMYEGAPSKEEVLAERAVMSFREPAQVDGKGKGRLSNIVFGSFIPSNEAEGSGTAGERIGNRPRAIIPIIDPENYEVVQFGPASHHTSAPAVAAGVPQATAEVDKNGKGEAKVTVEDADDDDEDGGARFHFGGGRDSSHPA